MVAWEESGELLDTRRRARLYLESLPPERYPRLVEAAGPLSEGVDPDAYFAFGLDLLLAGIKVMALPECLAVLSRGSMVAVPGVAARPPAPPMAATTSRPRSSRISSSFGPSPRARSKRGRAR